MATFNPEYTVIQSTLGSYFGYSLVIVSICPYFFETILNSKREIYNVYIGVFLILVILISWICLLVQLIFFNIRLRLINKTEENKHSVEKENTMSNIITAVFSLYLVVVFVLMIYLLKQLLSKNV